MILTNVQKLLSLSLSQFSKYSNFWLPVFFPGYNHISFQISEINGDDSKAILKMFQLLCDKHLLQLLKFKVEHFDRKTEKDSSKKNIYYKTKG